MKLSRPALPRPTQQESDRLTPIAIGMGLLCAGALLWRTRPSALDIPDPIPLGERPRRDALRSAAWKTRDKVSQVAPDNLGSPLGRSMVFAGATLLVTRLLDELAGD